MTISKLSKFSYFLYPIEPTYRVKKSLISGAWRKIVPFCATLLYGVFQFVWKINIFFGTLMALKKTVNLFSLKIKSLEKQKSVYKLLLSKSKIL